MKTYRKFINTKLQKASMTKKELINMKKSDMKGTSNT